MKRGLHASGKVFAPNPPALNVIPIHQEVENRCKSTAVNSFR